MISIVSAYAPQTGSPDEVKETFWRDFRETVQRIPKEERLVIGADLNGHLGEGNSGDEEVMGIYGLGERNAAGWTAVDFTKIMELAISNTFFLKKPRQSHLQ